MANSRFRALMLLSVLFCLTVLVSRLKILVAAGGDQIDGSINGEDENFMLTEEESSLDINAASGLTPNAEKNENVYNDALYVAPDIGSEVDGRSEVDERSELCNTNTYTAILPPPYNNISNMVCAPVWNTFILRYHKGEENLMTFILSAVYTTGWVGMGFSRDGKMAGGSAMVGWINTKGHPRIKQYYLQGNRPSQVIVDAGELDITKIPPAIVLDKATVYLAFQAKFQKHLRRQPILLAFGTSYPKHHRLSMHNDKTTILFDFSVGAASAVNFNPGKMITNHGILATLAWGFFLPAGAIIARYLKHKEPLWYYLHAGIQFVGFLLSLAAVVIGQQIYAKIDVDLPAHRGIDVDIPAHRGIGIFVLVLSILQILAFFLRPKKDAKFRKYWNWYHGWCGRISLFFGVFNIVWGMHIASAGIAWKTIFGLQITVILVTVIILETLLWMREPENNKLPPSLQMNAIQ